MDLDAKAVRPSALKTAPEPVLEPPGSKEGLVSSYNRSGGVGNSISIALFFAVYSLLHLTAFPSVPGNLFNLANYEGTNYYN
jgi:hypothetical protein